MAPNPGISRIDSTGNITLFSGANCFSIAFDKNGTLFCAQEGSIGKIDHGGTLSPFALLPWIGEPSSAFSIAVDNSGDLYATNAAEGHSSPSDQIVKVDPTGKATVLTQGNLLSVPRGIAVGNNGLVYVANVSSNTILTIDSAGAQKVFSSGQLLGQPYNLALDGSGNLYVSNVYSPSGSAHIIVKMDPAGNQFIFSTMPDPTIPFTLAFSPASYYFSGFLPPVSSPPTVNAGKAGRTYPIKWQLIQSGVFVSALAATRSLSFQNTSCSGFGSASSDAVGAIADGVSSLRYDSTANQYIYNWASPSQPGCYILTLTLDTNQSFSAYFNLK